MTHKSGGFPPVGAILSSPQWPERVRVVRVEPKGKNRALIEATTLGENPGSA